MAQNQNIIIILSDAVRARNLSCYGYHKKTSPNIDNLASNGVLFEKAFTAVPYTDSSLTTIFTGLFPSSHGIIMHGGKVSQQQLQSFSRSGASTMAEILHSKGYSTCAIDWIDRWHKRGFERYESSGGGEEFLKGWQASQAHRHSGGITQEKASLNQRIVKPYFDRLPLPIRKSISSVYHVLQPKNQSFGPSAETYTDLAVRFIKENVNREFFLFVHFWDTHTPYASPKRYAKQYYNGTQGMTVKDILKEVAYDSQKRQDILSYSLSDTAQIIAKYDGAIAYVDHEIGRLIHALKEEKGLFDRTIIIVTSDHGESLIEHGIYFDHHGLYDETIHVPLVVSYPAAQPKGLRLSGFVQHVDLLPTILDMLGQKRNQTMCDGKSLLPMIEDRVMELHPFIYAEEFQWEQKKALRTKRYKYIVTSKETSVCERCGIMHGDMEELYDLEKDPAETKNIALKEPQITVMFRKELSHWLEQLDHKRATREKMALKKRIRGLKQINRKETMQ